MSAAPTVTELIDLVLDLSDHERSKLLGWFIGGLVGDPDGKDALRKEVEAIVAARA